MQQGTPPSVPAPRHLPTAAPCGSPLLGSVLSVDDSGSVSDSNSHQPHRAPEQPQGSEQSVVLLLPAFVHSRGFHHQPGHHPTYLARGSPELQAGNLLAWAVDLEMGQGGLGPYQSCPRPSVFSVSPGPRTAAEFARHPPWGSCPGGYCRWPAAYHLAQGCQSCISRGGGWEGAWHVKDRTPHPVSYFFHPVPRALLPVCHTAFLDVRDDQGLPSLPAGC